MRNSAYPYISKCVHYTLQRHVLPRCINDNETFQEGRCGELFPNRSIVSSNTIKSSRSFIKQNNFTFFAFVLVCHRNGFDRDLHITQ